MKARSSCCGARVGKRVVKGPGFWLATIATSGLWLLTGIGPKYTFCRSCGNRCGIKQQ